MLVLPDFSISKNQAKNNFISVVSESSARDRKKNEAEPVPYRDINCLIILLTFSSCRTWSPLNTGFSTGIQKQPGFRLSPEWQC